MNSCLLKLFAMLFLTNICSCTPTMHFQTLVQSSTQVPLKIYPIHLSNGSFLDVKLTYIHPTQNLSLGLYQQSIENENKKYQQSQQSTLSYPLTRTLNYSSSFPQMYFIIIYPTATPIQEDSLNFTLTYTIDNQSETFQSQFPYKYLTLTPKYHVTPLTITCVPPPHIRVSLHIIYGNSTVVQIGQFQATDLQHTYGVYDTFQYRLEVDETVGIGIEYLQGWVQGANEDGVGMYLKIDGAYYLANHEINKGASYFALILLVVCILGCGFYFSNNIYMKSHTVMPIDISGVPAASVPESAVQIGSIVSLIKGKQKQYDQFNQQIQPRGWVSEQKFDPKKETGIENFDIK